jgi:polyvinyl alcohol dehydrogenase (cytochrome)
MIARGSRARPLLFVLTIALLAAAAACSAGNKQPSSSGPEWPTFSANLERTGANPNETLLTKETVSKLVVKWKFPTQGPVAASPVVATVDVPGEGSERIVVAGSYDGNVYAIRASDGKEIWRFTVKPDPGISYGIIAATPSIVKVGGKWRVYAAGGETMYALDAGTGAKIWEFDAGTGCTTCDDKTERNEILSSPAVLPDQDLVLFGMDINDRTPGKGGFYALSAKDGRLRWYFDVDAGKACSPNADDNIRRFDGFHTAEQLGLPSDFLSTRAGCNFDRTETACGNVWSPVSVDTKRQVIYFTTGNCDTDNDPQTPKPSPPMPLYDDAIVALHYDGSPAWTWRPREVDNNDFDFGAGPNLLTATIGGQERDAVGVGGKDGTYYLLDRAGTNALTGKIEPYWTKHVVTGSDIGGFTGTAAVLGDKIFVVTAISEGGAPAWALNAGDGSVVWTQPNSVPFYGGTSAVPGVVFTGGIDTKLHAYDADTGAVLASFPLGGLGFSEAAIVDGVVYIGSGFGTSSGTGPDVARQAAQTPATVWAFCIQGKEGCQGGAQ